MLFYKEVTVMLQFVMQTKKKNPENQPQEKQKSPK